MMMFAVRSSAATERSLGRTHCLGRSDGQGDLRGYTLSSGCRRALPGRGVGGSEADEVAHTFGAPGTHEYVCIRHEVQHMIRNEL